MTQRYGPDDVAIVGMACRVAGGNHTPDQLWEFLLGKKDASGPIPPERWEPYRRRDARNAAILDSIPSRGYFLDDLEGFDAAFFGISQMEAEQMDPQQRLSLEVAWESLENAGISPTCLVGSDTAVFWGVNLHDYAGLLLEDLPNTEAWMGIGTAHCGVPNRISHHLSLMGPSPAVDAACASSLVAVHHGVQALRSGESAVAIVGGVNALCGPGLFCTLDKAGALSPDGRCCSFDHGARGYGRGEGAASIVLKRTSRAIRDGDEILAVIRGTAVAHDGKTRGIMAPNSDSQALVARKALAVAGIDPLSVGYIEAHATSTPLGDPTEVSALSRVYGSGAGRRVDNPCYIGSIKPNIGHLEAGAGAMGLIKAVLAVRNGMLPPQANLDKLTERIDWDSCGLEVVQESVEWPRLDEIRRAAVCSYGYGGTVSHAIIESFEPAPVAKLQVKKPEPCPIILSAPQESRLSAQAQALQEWIEANPLKDSLRSVASTLALGRQHHNFRTALVVDSLEEALSGLKKLAEGQGRLPATCIQSRVLGPEANQSIVWIFSGHGAQWPGMGKDLLQNCHFRGAVEPLDRIIESEIGVSPIALLRSGAFESSDHVQILTYVMQIGISAVLNSYGNFPKAVIGHSVGEIAAAVIAGVLSSEQGAIVVTRRSVLYRQVMDQGRMALVGKPYAEVSRDLQSREPDVVAAIDSSPSSCVISGPSEAVARVAEQYKQRSVKVWMVKTDIAFHSPAMERLRDPLLKVLDGELSPEPPRQARLYSTSLQDPRGHDLRDAQYWANNMVNPVQLAHTVQAAVDDSYRVFLEISPHPILSHSITETLVSQGVEEDEGCIIHTLTRDQPPERSILCAVSQLHCRGLSVDWKLRLPGPQALGLPNIRWLHRHTWRKTEPGSVTAPMMHSVSSHALVGDGLAIAGTDTTVYTTNLDRGNKPFPGTHPLHGTEIVPAACLFNTFIKATGANVLENVTLRVPVAVDTPRSIQVIAQSGDTKILSRLVPHQDHADAENSSWVTHTTARCLTQDLGPGQHFNVSAVGARIKKRLSDTFSTDYLAKVGVAEMGFPWAVSEHYGDHRAMG